MPYAARWDTDSQDKASDEYQMNPALERTVIVSSILTTAAMLDNCELAVSSNGQMCFHYCIVALKTQNISHLTLVFQILWLGLIRDIFR